MKRTLVAVALATIFVLALAMPAFSFYLPSQTFEHNVAGKLEDGRIIIHRTQMGHLDPVGAARNRVQVRGDYQFFNFNRSSAQRNFHMAVEQDYDFVTAVGAITPVRVTSTIDLLTPARHTYLGAHVVPSAMYWGANVPALYLGALLGGIVGQPWTDSDANSGLFNAATTQRWAAEVEANAGYSGRLTQDYAVGYGPFADTQAFLGNNPLNLGLGWNWGTLGQNVPPLNTRGYTSYSHFPGDFFEIDQFVRTSNGTVRRFINVSSPWSGGHLFEDFAATGRIEIREDFEMVNMIPGGYGYPAPAAAVWHDLWI